MPDDAIEAPLSRCVIAVSIARAEKAKLFQGEGTLPACLQALGARFGAPTPAPLSPFGGSHTGCLN